MTQVEDIMLNDLDRNFLNEVNEKFLKIKKYEGEHILIFNIKPFWCVEQQLLIPNLISHPINYYYRKYNENNKRFKHKDIIKNIIEWELNENEKSYLTKIELDSLINFYKKMS